MLLSRACTVLLATAALAADKNIEPARSGNDAVDLVGSVASGRQDSLKLLGVDPGHEMIVVEIEVRRKGDTRVSIARDDFTLISRKDGQRSEALHPAQIAGSGTLMVSSRAAGAAGGVMNQQRGPIWGGMPGTGGRPRRIGGDEDVVGVAPGETRAEVREDKSADSPLMAALKEKEVTLGEVEESSRGLLYFILDGKHKVKDLELMYKGPGGTLMLDFQR